MSNTLFALHWEEIDLSTILLNHNGFGAKMIVDGDRKFIFVHDDDENEE